MEIKIEQLSTTGIESGMPYICPMPIHQPGRSWNMSKAIFRRPLMIHPLWYLLVAPFVLELSWFTFSTKIYAGWWCTYPSEKYESQLGWLFPIYGKIKVMFQSPPSSMEMCGRFKKTRLTFRAPSNCRRAPGTPSTYENLPQDPHIGKGGPTKTRRGS